MKKYVERYEGARDEVENYLKASGKSYADIAAFPVSGRQHDVAMVVDKKSKQLAGYIDINPWRR